MSYSDRLAVATVASLSVELYGVTSLYAHDWLAVPTGCDLVHGSCLVLLSNAAAVYGFCFRRVLQAFDVLRDRNEVFADH